MTIAEAKDALQRAEEIRRRAEAVLARDQLLAPCRALWMEAHQEAIRALTATRRFLEGRTT